MFYGFLWGFTGFYWVSLVTGRDIWPRCCSFSFIGRGGWSWRVERFLFYFFHFFSVKFSLENFFASCCFFGRRRNVPTPFLFFFFIFFFLFLLLKGGPHTKFLFLFWSFWNIFLSPFVLSNARSSGENLRSFAFDFVIECLFFDFKTKKGPKHFSLLRLFGLRPSMADFEFKYSVLLKFTFCWEILRPFRFFLLCSFFPCPFAAADRWIFLFFVFFCFERKKTLAPLPIGEPVVDTVGGACKNKTKTNEIRCQNHSTTTHSSRAK